MSNKGKVITILLILLTAVSIVVSGIIYLQLEKEQSQNASLSKKISTLETEKANLEKQIEQHKSELAEANTKLEEADKKIKELTLSLDEEKNKNQEAVASINKDLEEVKNAKADLEKKISQNQDEINSLKAQIEKLKKEKEDLEKKIKDGASKSDVQLGKIVVAPETIAAGTDASLNKDAASLSAPLEGKILVVNKEYAFVVINLGSRDGISVNDTLSVYQKDKYIGDIIVERVDTAMCSANFSDPNLREIVKENDRVTTKSQ
mgnify:CR=1 FL=1